VAVTPIPSFTVDAALTTSFGSPSTRVALPGTPASDATVRLLNLSGAAGTPQAILNIATGS